MSIGPMNRELTPYRDLDEVLIDYAETSRSVLADNFIGVYLLGSLAIGDFDLTSDVGSCTSGNYERPSPEYVMM
ncbi:hypothetical protein ABH923_002863 [Leifsonia sp. EB41]|uniref:hypothetical protein n=1 Tax=Leifsonia sp. EB41 TaxID=3156260 RepID=UPI00351564D7